MKKQVITFLKLKLLGKEMTDEACDTSDLIEQVDASCQRIDLLQKVDVACDTDNLVELAETKTMIDD